MPNFTFVVAFPLNGSLPSGNFSTAGLALSKVTVPGPRYFDQISATGGRFAVSGAPVPLVYFRSSVTQTVNASGADTDAVRAGAAASVAIGPCIPEPFCSNRSTGGVLFTA